MIPPIYLKIIESGVRMETLEIAEDNITTEVMDHRISSNRLPGPGYNNKKHRKGHFIL